MCITDMETEPGTSNAVFPPDRKKGRCFLAMTMTMEEKLHVAKKHLDLQNPLLCLTRASNQNNAKTKCRSGK